MSGLELKTNIAGRGITPKAGVLGSTSLLCLLCVVNRTLILVLRSQQHYLHMDLSDLVLLRTLLPGHH